MDPEATHPQDEALVRALAALASPVRFALLRKLRVPRTLSEIEVRTPADEGDAARKISRQAVREHLDRLIDIGVVTAREAEREYGPTVEYTLNHQTLYALSEELRGLARMRPAAEPHAATVRGAPPSGDARPGSGPCLVLVKGLEEGRCFPLRPPPSGMAEWVVGRRRGLAVSLDFDPFISMEHASVTWDGGGFAVLDLPDSRNGTSLNFQPIPKGVPQPLRQGDLVGVGRTLLLFRG